MAERRVANVTGGGMYQAATNRTCERAIISNGRRPNDITNGTYVLGTRLINFNILIITFQSLSEVPNLSSTALKVGYANQPFAVSISGQI